MNIAFSGDGVLYASARLLKLLVVLDGSVKRHGGSDTALQAG